MSNRYRDGLRLGVEVDGGVAEFTAVTGSAQAADPRKVIRISVSSWRTTAEDVERTVAAFERELAAIA